MRIKGLLVILNFSDEDAEISLKFNGPIDSLINTGLIWNGSNEKDDKTITGFLTAFSGWIGKYQSNKLP